MTTDAPTTDTTTTPTDPPWVPPLKSPSFKIRLIGGPNNGELWTFDAASMRRVLVRPVPRRWLTPAERAKDRLIPLMSVYRRRRPSDRDPKGHLIYFYSGRR